VSGLGRPVTVYPAVTGRRGWPGAARTRSVDRAWFGDPHAFDPEYPAEDVEVAVVVQHCRATLGGRGGDQVVGGG
jgi:hypothetical protein